MAASHFCKKDLSGEHKIFSKKTKKRGNLDDGDNRNGMKFDTTYADYYRELKFLPKIKQAGLNNVEWCALDQPVDKSG